MGGARTVTVCGKPQDKMSPIFLVNDSEYAARPKGGLVKYLTYVRQQNKQWEHVHPLRTGPLPIQMEVAQDRERSAFTHFKETSCLLILAKKCRRVKVMLPPTSKSRAVSWISPGRKRAEVIIRQRHQSAFVGEYKERAIRTIL